MVVIRCPGLDDRVPPLFEVVVPAGGGERDERIRPILRGFPVGGQLLRCGQVAEPHIGVVQDCPAQRLPFRRERGERPERRDPGLPGGIGQQRHRGLQIVGGSQCDERVARTAPR